MVYSIVSGVVSLETTEERRHTSHQTLTHRWVRSSYCEPCCTNRGSIWASCEIRVHLKANKASMSIIRWGWSTALKTQHALLKTMRSTIVCYLFIGFWKNHANFFNMLQMIKLFA